MKVSFSAVVLLLIAGCSSAPLKPEAPAGELEASLSPEDLGIHRCLHSKKAPFPELKKTCLFGTPYEEILKRTPSANDNEVILKNNWFFDSRENLEKFYRVSRGFLRAQSRIMARNGGKLVNKKAIGVEGSVYIGVGRGWEAQFAVHNDKLGFICSPSWSLQSDIGIEGDVSVARSLSCQSNDDFAGEDVSFGASISGELIGLPVSVGLSYGMSIDPRAFQQKIADARKTGLLSLQSLREELDRLNSPEIKNVLAKHHRSALPLLTLALRPLSLFEFTSPNLVNRSDLTAFVRELVKNDRSATGLFRAYYQRQLKARLAAARLHNLNAFLGALAASVTGCDSISGSASLGVSVLPISAGASYTNSFLLAEVGAQELGTFARLTTMALLNPFLLPSQDLRNVVKVARTLVAIPQNVQRHCLK